LQGHARHIPTIRYTRYVLNTIADEVWDVMTEFAAAR
jgi:hypothetical protein